MGPIVAFAQPAPLPPMTQLPKLPMGGYFHCAAALLAVAGSQVESWTCWLLEKLALDAARQ